MIVHKSRKKAVRITVAGFLAGIAGGLILYCVRDVVLGWCFVATAGFTLLYGSGSLYDRRPYIVLTEDGITEMFTIRGQIEWEAIRYADDFYFRGQYWVRSMAAARTQPRWWSVWLPPNSTRPGAEKISSFMELPSIEKAGGRGASPSWQSV